MRVAGGSVAGGAGPICLAFDADKSAAFFLALGSLNLAGGYVYLTVNRPASASPELPRSTAAMPAARVPALQSVEVLRPGPQRMHAGAESRRRAPVVVGC